MLRRAVCLALLGVAIATRAAPADADQAWRAAAREAQLDDAEIEHLARTRLLLSTQSDRQIFDAYRRARTPFVTTDSVLSAYHVLLEASVARLEAARRPRLVWLLQGLWEQLPATPASPPRARLTVAVALRLLGEDVPGLSPAEQTLVADEVACIEAAKGTGKPAWLAPYDEESFPWIDYASHRPRGLYDEYESIRGAFRAIRWLQSVPFRPDVPEEMAAARALRGAAEGRLAEWHDFTATFHQFIGPPFQRSVFEADPPPATGAGAGRSDADALARPQAARAAVILPAAEPPENALFERLGEGESRRRLPSGLDVGVALGSSYAESQPSAAPTAVRGELLPGPGDESVAAQFRAFLGELVADPPPDAPALLRGDAWRAKSLGTALAGWACARHTWALQARSSVRVFGVPKPAPVGFVEPSPRIFDRLAALSRSTSRALERGEAFSGAGAWLPARWEALAAACQTLAAMARRQIDGVAWTEEESTFLSGYGLQLARLHLYDDAASESPRDDAPRVTPVATVASASGGYAVHLQVGVGRPRRLYVLWPGPDGDVLCVGSVLPYHETAEEEHVTDLDWRGRFGGDDPPPALPDWMRPLRPDAR